MFAVQGWNVSPTALVTEQAKKPKPPTNPDSGPQTHKRKRLEQQEASRKILGSELERLWDQRFGRDSDGAQRKKVNEKKSKKSAKHGNTSKDLKQDNARRVDSSQTQDVQDDVDSPSQANSPQHSPPDGSALNPKQTTASRKQKTKKQSRQDEQAATAAAKVITTTLPPQAPPPTNLTPLQAKMRSKLTSARFRHLNETLYTNPSSTSLSLFSTSPDLFAEYHAGFSQQVLSSWPLNPITAFINTIKSRGPLRSTNPNPLPRRKTQSCTIADLGCGDAPLARALIPGFTKKLQLTIHSYDLHAPNSHVTVADVANLPLRDGEADIAIFCLSLMGTNWVDFVEEAWRILRGDGKGEVWIAEVKSRFGRVGERSGGARPGNAVNHSVGKRRKEGAGGGPGRKGKKNKGGDADAGDEDDEATLPADLFTSDHAAQANGPDMPDLRPFIDVWTRRGFQLRPDSVDASNKMFVSMSFVKSGIPTAGKHRGKKWTGKQYERVGKPGDDDDDDDVEREREGKVLKPCVYKTR
jgi:ribosomal RNA-processing protein 8